MRIALLGGTGRVGSVVLPHLLENGYSVNLLVRDSSSLEESRRQHIISGDACNENDIDRTLKGCQAVISCLGTDKSDVISRSMPLVLKSMRKHSISRIITVGTAGILQARSADHLYRFQTDESKRKSTKAAEDHLKAYLMLKSSTFDWTIVCPTYLPDGERLGHYRTEKDLLPLNGKSISIYDTGDYIYKLLHSKTNDFNKCRVGICY